MINVSDESASLAEFVAQIVDLTDRVQDAAIRRIHRMKGFEAELDADLSSIGQELMQGVPHAFALPGDILASGRQTTDYHDKARRPNLRCRIEDSKIGIDRPAKTSIVGDIQPMAR